MDTNVIVASAAVTLKLAVAVVPPWMSRLRNESWLVCSKNRSSNATTSKSGTNPIALEHRMKVKNVRISGAQTFTHRRPTFGCTTESRKNTTTASSPFMKPDGISRSCFK